MTPRFVSGLFDSRTDAEQAADRLLASGVPREDIGVVMRHEPVPPYSNRMQAAAGAGIGGAIGTAVGAVLAAIAALGTTLVIPGLGLLVAGPLAAALVGAGAGGATGGLIGALVGAGIPEPHAREYERALHAGGVLLTVEAETDDAARDAELQLLHLGARNVHVGAEEPVEEPA